MSSDRTPSEHPAARLAAHLPRPAYRHLALLSIVAAIVATILSIAPDDAGATRGAGLTTAPHPAAVTSTGPGESLALPAPRPSRLSTRPPPGDAAPSGTWHTVTVRRGDNLARIFDRLGLSPGQLHAVLQAGGPVKHLRHLYPGENIRVRIGDHQQLLELIHETDPVHSLRVTADGGGFAARQVVLPVEIRTAHASGTIKDSLFQAAQDAGLSDNLTMELAAIFGWDIDFALDIREGDRFTVIYEEQYLNGDKIGEGDIVAAEFASHGKTYRAVRYTDASGHTDYYSPNGRSMRKAFLRTPVKFTRISSRFSLHRMHPILNRIRAHKGVDYAAPRGTPIRATGDGRIIFKGRRGGYGRTIIIQHGHHYSTLYGHMSAYNRHSRVGARVKQGQVIGYVGMSGLATGPHLHYEFRINGVHRNPLTVKLPAARPIARRYQRDFQRQATPLLSQLEVLDRFRLARE